MFTGYCRSCSAAFRCAPPDLKRLPRYGLTPEKYRSLLIRQRGRCAICRKRFRRTLGPHIDHCHRTGHVRGILCRGCNSGIGFLGDAPLLVKRALFYLQTGRREARREKKRTAK